MTDNSTTGIWKVPPTFFPNNRILLAALAVIFVVGSVLVIVFEQKIKTDTLLEEASLIEDQLAIRTRLLATELQDSRLKVRFLYSTPPISGMVRAEKSGGVDPYDGTTTALWKSRLETIFIGFMENNPEVTQARYIGLHDNGKELVRVQRNQGSINIIPKAQLQQKGDRDYFHQIVQKSRGEIYVSNFDLNREFGKVTFPYVPTYRVGMPVYDDAQQMFGIIILNFNAQVILDHLLQNLHDNFDFYLMNNTGGFLLHPDTIENFRFDLGQDSRWSLYFSEAQMVDADKRLQKVMKRNSGRGLYLLSSKLPLSGPEDGRYLELVVGMDERHLQSLVMQQRGKTLVMAGVVLGITIVFLVFYQANVTKSINLSVAKSRFEAIVNGSSDAIIGMDQNGIVISWNTSAQDIFGYAEHYTLGRPLVELLQSVDHTTVVAEAIAEVSEGNHLSPLQVKALRRNGSSITISLSMSPIVTESGRVTGVAAIVRDITDQVAIEQQIRELNSSLEQQVQQRTRELEDARNEALSASKAKSSFIANISHEIRTPLNGVIGMLNLLKKDLTQPHLVRYLGMAESSSETLSALINDILDLSKIEAGKLELDNVEYDLLQLVSDLASSMSIKPHQKGVQFMLDLSGLDQCKVQGDPVRLRQILTNLIGNAIKFTAAGEIQLTISTRLMDDGRVDIQGQVRDTGIGISDENLNNLFDVFSQEDNSITRRFGGSGLGLSITRQLCNMMQGQLTVASEKGKGSTFGFRIVQRAVAGNVDLFSGLDLSGHRLLVVDPSLACGQILQRYLSDWHADQVDLLSEFPAQWDAATQPAFDLMLVDERAWNAELNAVAKPLAKQIIVMRHQLVNREAVAPHPGEPGTMLKPITPQELARMVVQQLGLDSSWNQKLIPTTLAADESESRLEGFKAYAGRHVLVVDDNSINQEVACGLIQDNSLKTHCVNNGQEAIDLLQAPQAPAFALILMDCQMPVMDGYSATRAIRAGEAGEGFTNIPVIAMTASAMAGDRERCMLAGMNDYVTKPLDPDAFDATLLHWLKQSPDGAVGTAAPQDDALIWDKPALLKRVKQREDRLQELLSIFKGVMPERVENLQQAMDEKDYPTIQSLAHAVKGSVGSIGGMRLHALCERIEAVAREEDGKDFEYLKQQLVQEYDALMVALDQREAG
jgi:two-component system sensor histidine kinase/response regulator